MTATLTIEKATYDMSGITFANATVNYDGEAHSIYISGNLPSGVTVTYEGNEQTAAGVYTVTATFIVDAANYNVPAAMIATLTIVPTYPVTVIDGSGSGNYTEGATVSITADAAPSGQTFSKWVSEDGVTFADEAAQSTTFVMPAHSVTVTATYIDLPPETYSITLSNDGNGSAIATVNGSTANFAMAGTVVTLTATANANFEFKSWEILEGAITDLDLNANPATFTMPAEGVKVKGHFVGSGIGNYELRITNYVVWPNPTTGVVHISYNSYNSYNSYLSVFDAAGRLVLEKDDKNFKNDRNFKEREEMMVDISNLPNGIYYLRIGSETVKIVKFK
jgi:hypothetical protein